MNVLAGLTAAVFSTSAATAAALPPPGAVADRPAAGPAAPCTGMRYASSTNTLYLTLPRAYTLSSVRAACAGAPLALVDAKTKTWQLSGDLVLTNGARLVLHGDRARGGGDVNTLRLRSRASNLPTEVSAVTAKFGSIDADAVTVTSWDDVAGRPDTVPALPAGSAPTARGRAFVRVVSFADARGAHQSRMTINRSTFTNLGYDAPESYGVSYKSQHCGRVNPAACLKAPVTGWQQHSTFAGNYMGTYYWGAADMRFVGNRYTGNTSYGLNGHDAARNLTISTNRFDHNGNHGVICSQRCDRIAIVGNTADHNGMVPWRGPDPAQESSGQVHGIMIHRGVTHAVISGNRVFDHPNGAGIAVFDSAGALVARNSVVRAKYGLRLSVGASGNRFERNQVVGSTLHGVFCYQGATDRPQYTNRTGRPNGNVFVGNVFAGGGGNAIRLTDSDRFTFAANVIRNTRFPLALVRSTGIVFTGNTLPARLVVTLHGTPGRPSTVRIVPRAGVTVSADRHSKAVLR